MLWPKVLSIFNIIFYILIINGSEGVSTKTPRQGHGVMDSVNEGLKFAGGMFGINTAADVANLVAKAFSSATSRRKPNLWSLFQQSLAPTTSEEDIASHTSEQAPNSQEHTEETNPKQYLASAPPKDNLGPNVGTSNFIVSLLRMVGFDASKLGALAINALILITQTIASTILAATKSQRPNAGSSPSDAANNPGPEEQYEPHDHQPRQLRDGDPIDWFMQTPTKDMQNLLRDIVDAGLAERITDMIGNYETESGQAACLKMLVCKSSPFIWGMQKSLAKRLDPNSTHADDGAQQKEFERNEEDSELNVSSFFTHLPSISEFREYSDKCEERYSADCNTTNLYE